MSRPNIADYDWLLAFTTDCTGHCETGDCDCIHPQLHAPHPDIRHTWDDWDYSDIEGPTACGIGIRSMIPGFGSRLSCIRCTECCRLTGLPPGVGSPKNDQTCRAILGMDTGQP